ncbi:MAG: Crp/Fnr family transcriptional regulator [Deinococcota bacterium]|jgi:CRP/FNR family transcriptional regulator|nr:Crp/Fnr family transcriptional regulator [Deinococcota bacterium]
MLSIPQASPQACIPPEVVPSTLAHPTRTLQPNDVLYEAGREASSLYIVNYGVLKAIVPTSLGRDRIADLYGPGDILGTAALDGANHAETVIAVHDACLTPIDPQQALSDRKLRDFIVQGLARQLRRSREAIDDAELPVGARVTRAFLRLSQRFGQGADEGQGIKLPLALTHEDLASLTGSSRVTITRILGELRGEGALSGTRGVYLANVKGLEAATDNYVMQAI